MSPLSHPSGRLSELASHKGNRERMERVGKGAVMQVDGYRHAEGEHRTDGRGERGRWGIKGKWNS